MRSKSPTDPFVNYVRSTTRDSPINIASARVLMGAYLIWKILSIDWGSLAEWPLPVYQSYRWFFFPEATLPFLNVEKWIVVGLLIAVIAGYHLRVTTFSAALLITHMGGLRLPINPSGGTEALFIASYLLLLFGLYSDQDRLSVDGIRRQTNVAAERLDERLQSTDREAFEMSALKWFLVVLGILYFGAGLQKVLANPGLAWTAPESLARYIALNSFADHDYRTVGELLISYPTLTAVSAWGTLVLEMGLLVAALTKRSVTPFVLGLIGFHTTIALALDPFFFDFIVFLTLFAAFDAGISRLTWDRSIDVVYDGHSHGVMRLLYVFKMLDVNDRLSFYSHAAAVDRFGESLDIDRSKNLAIVIDRTVYDGTDALHQVFARCWLFAPLLYADRVREKLLGRTEITETH